MTSRLRQAQQEIQRRERAEREWLGDTTQGRPAFAQAEALDREGIPSCHVWLAPEGEAPDHLSGTEALRRWQAGACAMCSASRGRLLVDHCHKTGLVRGLLCTSCNTAEGLQDAPSFVAYRKRPPAAILGVEEQYGTPWGNQSPGHITAERRVVHVDAAEAVFADVTPKFRKTL